MTDKTFSREKLEKEETPSSATHEPGAALLQTGKEAFSHFQEHNRHEEEMQRRSLGWLGKVLGDRSSAPLSIAFCVILIGLISLIATFLVIKWYAPNEITSTKLLDFSSTLILTPLAYVFGRGGRS